MRVLFLVNSLDFFVSHRANLAEMIVRNSGEVVIGFGESSSEAIMLCTENGWNLCDLRLKRSKLIGLSFFLLCKRQLALIKHFRPDLTHSITLPFVVASSVCSIFSRDQKYILSIAGFGRLVPQSRNFLRSLPWFLLSFFFRLMSRNNNLSFITQNSRDTKFLVEKSKINTGSVFQINGSGVDFNVFQKKKFEIEAKKLRFIFTGRLLRSKGVLVYRDAVRLLNSSGYNADFIIVGATDSGNPDSITVAEYQSLSNTRNIEVLNYTKNIVVQLMASDVFVFPSFYGEGLAKSLLEAAAVGLPIITTNEPGCREAVVDNESGFLIPARDPIALAEKMQIFIKEKSLVKKMGGFSHDFAKKHFDIRSVTLEHAMIYRKVVQVGSLKP